MKDLGGNEGTNKAGHIDLGVPNSGHPNGTYVQTVSNINVSIHGNSALYTAIYQNWNVARNPICTSLGLYTGKIDAGPQTWRWTDHRVSPFRADESEDAARNFIWQPIVREFQQTFVS
ncbi:hypothetical protein J7I84_01810 [Arthrobacter sp. ISL-85]|nr:hypothetical protein [Arthrobacter sp. ISL-85]